MDSPGFEPGASPRFRCAPAGPKQGLSPPLVTIHGFTPIMTRLERVSPEEAVQMYLQNRRAEVSKSTIYEHKCRLTRFIEWASGIEGLADMNQLTRQIVFRYKSHRTDEVAPSTLENEMRTFRLFVRFCENYGCCSEGVAKSIDIPTAPKSKRSRDEQLEPENAEQILDYLSNYEYCSFRHTLFTLVWNLGARISGIRALDVEDFYETSPDGPYIEFVHRPQTETPLKNGWKSERKPPVQEALSAVIADWIEARRPDVEDEYGREPLLATEQGRPAKSTIQRNIYSMTRPCFYSNGCPHDRDTDECEAVGDYNQASKCPSSRSPHTLRRGRATANANNQMPEEMICDRMDMSPEVFREHYRQQTEDDKRELQREFLNR